MLRHGWHFACCHPKIETLGLCENEKMPLREYSPGIYCDQFNSEITSRSLFAATNSLCTATNEQKPRMAFMQTVLAFAIQPFFMLCLLFTSVENWSGDSAYYMCACKLARIIDLTVSIFIFFSFPLNVLQSFLWNSHIKTYLSLANSLH